MVPRAKDDAAGARTYRFWLPASAARAQAGAGRRRFSQRGEPLRPDERSHVGRPSPRPEDALITAVNPPRARPAAAHEAKTSARRFTLLDLAGGTGDIAFRVLEAGGSGTRATVVDINADMLAVGRA